MEPLDNKQLQNIGEHQRKDLEKRYFEFTKRLFAKFQIIYQNKWTQNFIIDGSHSEELYIETAKEWADALFGIDPEDMKQALKIVRDTLIWPPSPAEFISVCDKLSGFPTEDEVYDSLLFKNLKHPIIKSIYDKIGGWCLMHDTEKVVRQRVRELYETSVLKFKLKIRSDIESGKMLLSHQNQSTLIDKSKANTNAEGNDKKFIEGLILGEDENGHFLWNKKMIDLASNHFNKKAYYERRGYLMEMSSLKAITLPGQDSYDRERYFEEERAVQNMDREKRHVNAALLRAPVSTEIENNESNRSM